MRSYARDHHGFGRSTGPPCGARGCARRPQGSTLAVVRRRGSFEPDAMPLDEEVELARRALAGEREAVDCLVRAQLGPVRQRALKLRWYGVPIDDLVQEGMIGLLHSLPHYAPERRVRFMAFSARAVRLRMLRAIVEDRALGTATRDSSWGRRYFRSDQGSEAGGIRDSVQSTASGSDSFAWAAPSPRLRRVGLDSDGQLPQSIVSDVDVPLGGDPEQELERKQSVRIQREQVHSALERLSDRERLIVEQRVMADEPLSFRDIARTLGISGERVKQILSRALDKLRQALGRWAPDCA